jgi:hypothetical protein
VGCLICIRPNSTGAAGRSREHPVELASRWHELHLDAVIEKAARRFPLRKPVSPVVVANRPGADAIPAMTEFIQQPLALRLT